MKKIFYYTILMLSITTGTLQAQFVTTGTPTSNTVYTNGSVGIGVTSAPASSIKAYINGMTWISSQDVTGATIPLWIEGNNTGTYGTTTEGRLIRIKNLQSTAFYDLGINQNNGFFISKYMDNHPNSNPSFFISSAGNIGINTTATGERLVVNGNISTTGFIMPAGASIGKVLTSDASGVASWQIIPGISSQWTTSGNNIYYMAGNIGIGTTTSGERLVVNGNISTTGFIMPTGASFGKVLTSNASGGASWQTIPGISSQWTTTGNNIYYMVGNIGIGTTTPGERLVVNGNISTTGFIMLTGAGNGKVLTSDASGMATWQTVSGGASQWTTTGSNISFSNGNVGIGTTSPGERLHVQGNEILNGNLTISGDIYKNSTKLDFSALDTWKQTSNQIILLASNISSEAIATYAPMCIVTYKGNPIISQPNGTGMNGWQVSCELKGVVALKDSTLNVGIGTTNPTAKLDVVGDVKVSGNVSITGIAKVYGDASIYGTLRTNAIKVDPTTTAWPDFVFSKDHKLRSLKDLQIYIDKNSHLPGLPSASDVKENGIDLAEINRALLEKVEELTLYTLQIKKELDELKKKVR